MKTRHPLKRLGRAALIAFATLSLPLSTRAQGTAFTYQGRLNERGALADGTYDLRFTIYDKATGGTSPLDPVTIRDLAISNGLFTVELDFGALGSTPRWLEIEVRPASGRDYDVLSPRQSLTTTPRSHYALQAGDVLNPVPDALIPATVARLGGNNVFTGQVSFVVPPRWEGPPFTVNTAAQVPNLNADYLDGFDSGAFWKIVGNAGTSPDFHFLGTTDNQPLEFRVNNQPAWRLAYATSQFFTSPNIVGGFIENSVAPGFVGGFIGAGGLPGDGLFPSNPNKVNNHFGSIGGGVGNTAGGFSSHVGGGRFNFCGGGDSLIVGGYGNTNPIAGFATVGGGHYNSVNGSWGTVPGGANNTVNGRYGFAAGRRAKALHDGAFVWADSQEVDFASTAFDQFCVRASGGVRLSPQTSLFWGGSQLWPDQGGAIELGNSLQNGVTPYIDFHFGSGSIEDFNVRLINNANGQLEMYRSSSGTAMARFNSGGLTVNGTFVSASDRNVKAGFEPVDARAILEKVAALPITRWHYTNDAATPHLGPVAQDFQAAFAVGPDDKHIATVDADGVALAAIQGLNEKLEARSAKGEGRLQQLEAENAELKARLEKLEQLVGKLTKE